MGLARLSLLDEDRPRTPSHIRLPNPFVRTKKIILIHRDLLRPHSNRLHSLEIRSPDQDLPLHPAIYNRLARLHRTMHRRDRYLVIQCHLNLKVRLGFEHQFKSEGGHTINRYPTQSWSVAGPGKDLIR